MLPEVPETGFSREHVAIICQEVCARMIVRSQSRSEETQPKAVIPPPPPKAPATSASGQFCPKCGGEMVRTGTCLTCQSCGDTSGGCS
jgi:hypothetical protein